MIPTVDVGAAVPVPAASDLVRALEELGRAQREAASRFARALDWPRASLGMLRLLAHRGPLQLGEAAACLRVDLSVASRQVSVLVDEGLARRRVDDDDRRARTVELTAAGRAAADRSARQLAALAAELFVEWSPEEIADATRQLRNVAAAVVQHHEKEEHHSR